jgi:hypothetical protein
MKADAAYLRLIEVGRHEPKSLLRIDDGGQLRPVSAT